jgi:hypothetical protein
MNYIQALIRQRELLEELNDKLSMFEHVPSGNQLLSPGQVMAELGLKKDDTSWKSIRKVLIEQYGMTKHKGVGYKIRRKNFQKFLDAKFGIQTK